MESPRRLTAQVNKVLTRMTSVSYYSVSIQRDVCK